MKLKVSSHLNIKITIVKGCEMEDYVMIKVNVIVDINVKVKKEVSGQLNVNLKVMSPPI